MQDPARIEQVLEAIRKVWVEEPDMRLGQLLLNAIHLSNPAADLYSVDDTVLVRKVESFAKHLAQSRRDQSRETS